MCLWLIAVKCLSSVKQDDSRPSNRPGFCDTVCAMRRHTLQSSFKQLLIELFIYPATGGKQGTILFLKGLYSVHNPQDNASLEAGLAEHMNDTYTIVCINTARLPDADGADAFIGKTFAEECEDVHAAYTELIALGVCTEDDRLIIVGNSFGGTTVLGVPELIRRAETILMIGSGCGKSPATEKPLLQTLPEEAVLLKNLAGFTGAFIFVRGGKDAVVPRSSQDKIIAAAQQARVLITCTFAGASHNLAFIDGGGGPFDRAAPLARFLALTGK